MAIIRKGILGGLSGKAGPVSGSSWKKISTLKIAKSSKKVDKKKLPAQCYRLDTMSKFLKFFTEVINIGFNNKKNKDSPFNRAMHYNLKSAISGSSRRYEINHHKIILSKGNREPAWSGKAEFVNNSQFKISWQIPETAKLKVIGNDRAIISIFDDTGYMFKSTKAIRSELSILTDIPASRIGHNFHIWIFFVSPDGKSVSNSDYLGILLTNNWNA